MNQVEQQQELSRLIKTLNRLSRIEHDEVIVMLMIRLAKIVHAHVMDVYEEAGTQKS